MPEQPALSVDSAPSPKSALGTSFTGFFVSIALCVTVVVAMELGSVGGSLVVACAVLFLLLPFGMDARLAGWAVGTALPTALHAFSIVNRYTPTCMPVGPSGMTSGCVVHIGWTWLAIASGLTFGGIFLMAVVVRRRPPSA